MKVLSDEQIDQWDQIASAATPGPWFTGYRGVHSRPIFNEYNRLECDIPVGASDDDPRWESLPESGVVCVPVVAGDTPTAQGAKDAAFVAAAREAVPTLVAEIKALRAENAALRSLLVHACDLQARSHDNERRLWAIRQTANHMSQPFTHARVQEKYDEWAGVVDGLRAALREACDVADAALMPNESVSREWYQQHADYRDRVRRVAELRELAGGKR